LVAGSTSTTTLRAVSVPNRVTLAMTRSSAVKGAMPGPETCRVIFTSGWSLIRVLVSAMPVICASASTPVASSAWVRAADLAPKFASPKAISTSAAVTRRPAQNIHFSKSLAPVAK
jgi:hypothetical protein